MTTTMSDRVIKILAQKKSCKDFVEKWKDKLTQYELKIGSNDDVIHLYRRYKTWFFNWTEPTSMMIYPDQLRVSSSYVEVDEAEDIAQILNYDVFVYTVG